MTYAASNQTKQALKMFQNFNTDTKLALLWYGYLDIKENLTPAPPDSVETVSSALFDKIKKLSSQEQLQAQRDMIDETGNEIGKAYSALDSSGRMNAWLLLARGMENGTIIQVPDDYQLPENTKEFTKAISQLDFEQRINFMRSLVSLR